MHHTVNARLATLAIVCSVFLAVDGAAAQTPQTPAPPAASPSEAPSAQGPMHPSADQLRAFIESLANFVVQSMPRGDPTPGASVPDDQELYPMPPAAAAAVPEMGDHHVTKPDDKTILIVHPFTRKIIGVIS